jgi:hypothetical protein
MLNKEPSSWASILSSSPLSLPPSHLTPTPLLPSKCLSWLWSTNQPVDYWILTASDQVSTSSVLDQGSVNSLYPGPCHSKKGMHIWEEDECPSLGPAPPDAGFSASRDSVGMGATRRGTASPHYGCPAEACECQQSEHVAFWNNCADTSSPICFSFKLHIHCICISYHVCTYSILSGKFTAVLNLRALILCLGQILHSCIPQNILKLRS